MAKYVLFVFNSIMLGIGLAMDAFSVSLANGFIEPEMKRKRKAYIAGIYAGFQFLMPVIGWFLVHNAAELFNGFQKFIPWIALGLLSFIGGKMIKEAIEEKKCSEDGNCKDCTNKECPRCGLDPKTNKLDFKCLMVQYHLTHTQMDRIPKLSGQGRLVMQDRIIFRDGIAVLVRDLVDQCEVIAVS